MRLAQNESSERIFMIGISRSKLTVAFLTVTLIFLPLTIHILHDNAMTYNIHGTPNINIETIGLESRVSGSSIPIFFSDNVSFPHISKHLPQAIIIGVRKCGTRALLEMLFLHPQIQKAAGEIHFFDRDENYSRGLEWYRGKMPYSFKGQVTIEKSPSYFVTPEVPERIRAMNSSVKLLLIVREPVTRAISDFTQLKSHAATVNTLTNNSGTPVVPSFQSPRTFEESVMKPDGSINESYRPIAISLYHNYLHQWLEVFSRDQIMVVNGDQLIEDPVPQLRKIERFLSLESQISKHNFYFNHTKGFYCLRNNTVEKCLRESKGRRHPRINSIVVTKLRKFFNEHNQRFYEMVGENLGWPEE